MQRRNLSLVSISGKMYRRANREAFSISSSSYGCIVNFRVKR